MVKAHNSSSIIHNSLPPLVVIVGETASGKSALAMELARQHGGEIISADSWQVYKGFDIGTAKPDKTQQIEIPHHLIDIAEPRDGFSAAAYKDLAKAAIDAVNKKSKLPIMVGGSGLYVDALLYDFSFLPAADASERKELNYKTINELLEIIQSKKYSMDGLDIHNKRRLVRLIESRGKRPEQKKLRPNSLVVGLSLPRAVLRKNIEQRVESMLARGLKNEVASLADTYGWGAEPMKGIGYREFKGYFDSQYSLAETKRKIVRSTLGLAKKQRTWFKRHPEIIWVKDYKNAEELVKKFLGSV